ncbi:diguanylate cyclase [Streptomyces lydicamycinicus]|uniref:Diguanylate cyclase n=1 Tax=Streptomyces lydicamycinicus TaxID=1546107 RepID=A0A0P4R6A1_9ACTN|nr:GGDEF domain-containing protein [Streptomyces lydicamycinicus]GAO08433.1 diguanylate cyclase [Streptomyces lydicamycinicus]
MSQTLMALAAALPVAAGWSLHSLMLRRRIEAARRDPLSGLWTREPFEERARRSLESGHRAVVVIDLDGFKQVNDTYGHAVGDAVIATAGQRLNRWSLNNGGVAARLGGDEFAAIVSVYSLADLHWTMDQLAEELCAPVEFEDHVLWVGFSAGVVRTQRGSRAAELSRLMRCADEVMYGAKQTGGGWMAAPDDAAPAYRTVNGRRDGRRGTSKEAA